MSFFKQQLEYLVESINATLKSYLSLLGDVLLKPIVAAGGKDISHWFDKKTKDVSTT